MSERQLISAGVTRGFLARADANGRWVQYPMTCREVVHFLVDTEKYAWTTNGRYYKPLGYWVELLGVSETPLKEALKKLTEPNDLYLGAPAVTKTVTEVPGYEYRNKRVYDQVRYDLTPEFRKTCVQFALWAMDRKNAKHIDRVRRKHPGVHGLLGLWDLIQGQE